MTNEELPWTEQTEEQSRRNLGEELNGVAGLVYRISTTSLDPDGMHAAALSVVCEAIYLARQVMLEDKLAQHDADDLTNAVAELERKARHWKISALHRQVWKHLPAHLKPDGGPTLKAIDFALYEWLEGGESDGKAPEELAAEFVEFCEAQQEESRKPTRKSKRR